MARPQIEDGYTPIANEILDHLVTLHLSPNQWQVILVVIRKTYGFHKKVDYIANSQIQEATGLCKEVVSRAVKELQARNLITRNGKMTGFQKDWEQWQLAESSTKVSSIANQEEVSSLVNSTPKVSSLANSEKLAISSTELAISSTELAESSTKVSSPIVTQKKETITKETIQKKGIELPDFVDKEVWNGFTEMRRKIKAPLTDYAAKLTLDELAKLRAAGEDANEVLRQSIRRSWRGVFPLKEDKGGTRQNPGRLPSKYETPEEYKARMAAARSGNSGV